MLNVTIWNEYIHEKESEKVAKVYPEGIHGAIAEMLGKCGEYNGDGGMRSYRRSS